MSRTGHVTCLFAGMHPKSIVCNEPRSSDYGLPQPRTRLYFLMLRSRDPLQDLTSPPPVAVTEQSLDRSHFPSAVACILFVQWCLS